MGKSNGEFTALEVAAPEPQEQPRRDSGRAKWIVGGIAVLAVAVGVIIVAVATSSSGCLVNCSPPTLASSIQTSAMMSTLRDLESIAMNHNGSRSVAQGYNASAEYIISRLAAEAPMLKVSRQYFTMTHAVDLRAPSLKQVSPVTQTLLAGTEFSTLSNQGGGTTTANVTHAAWYGCNTVDFAGFPNGHIALIQRGNCSFAQKVANAQQAGASGVLIFNSGSSANTMGLISGTLGSASSSVPVFGMPYSEGMLLVELLQYTFVTMSMDSLVTVQQLGTYNVVIEAPVGSPDNVVIVGSHLDSVDAGPGINDNGSGSSFNLELILQFYKLYVADSSKSSLIRNRPVFGFWAAEEFGLLGSKEYMKEMWSAGASEVAKIAAYLNFDMIGSPNYIRGVLDTYSVPAPAGSEGLSSLLTKAFSAQGLASQVIPYTGRSDYGPFIASGIPASSVETGAEVVKSPAERLTYGGLANAWQDPCYHQSCDTIANINQDVLGQVATAGASVTLDLLTQADVRAYIKAVTKP